MPYQNHLSGKTRRLNFFRRFFIITRLDTLLAGYTRRAGRRSVAAKFIPPHYLYPNNSFRSCTLNGIKFDVDLGDKNGHADYYGINDSILNKILSTINPGMNIYDIGGNIGSFALHFAQKVQPQGLVFSFEPSPVTYNLALKNITLNQFPNLKFFNIGVGNKKSKVFLSNVNPHNRGMSKIVPTAEDNYTQKEEIQVDTLDNLADALELPPPDVIKIDVEGYEHNVLLGADKTIATFHPKMFIELDDNNLKEQETSARDLIGHLEDLGYSIINCETKKELYREQDFSNCHFDIECNHKAR